MENVVNKKILVTGATGLLGTNLCKRLKQNGADIIILVKDAEKTEYTTVLGNIKKYSDIEETINKYEISEIIHLGAQTIVGSAYRNPFNTFETNIRGTYNVLEAARTHSNLIKKIIIASSDKAYGEINGTYTEETPLHGDFPYDVSKSCADLISQSYAKTYNLPIVISRCANLYGSADQNYSRLIPGTIKTILQGKTPIIRSNGKAIRDYLYVEDAVEGYIKLLICDTKPGEAFNFSLSNQTRVIDVVKLIMKLMNVEIEPIILNQTKAEIFYQHLDSSKAERELDWHAKTSLEEGLIETIKWYTKYLKKII